MQIVQSYKTKLVKPDFKNDIINTINIYRNAVSYIINVVNYNYEELLTYVGKNQKTYIEKLIHSTKNNIASFDFDKKFIKFPSYLRRSAIQDAIGIVSSYRSNLENYEKEKYETISNGRKFKKKPPKLSIKHFKCPAFYKGNMYKRLNDNTIELKIFTKNDWKFIKFNLRQTDVNYINKNCYSLKESSPILIKKGRNFYLSFSFSGDVKLDNTALEEQTIVSVDLGINKSAVCSLIKYDGTVLKRLFINQKRNKDYQNILINRLKLKQKQGGKYAANKSLWAKINGLNTQIVNDTVNKIINFAKENKANVLVFEYLDFKNKKKIYNKNNIAAKLNLWCHKRIIKKSEEKAHSIGIRFRRVNPKNTSALAYDGSGYVIRDKVNHSLCTFKTGKQYNCDLSASYNIGARYFIKEIEKATSKKKWADIVAKVPQVSTRTQCTLSTLINIVALLA